MNSLILPFLLPFLAGVIGFLDRKPSIFRRFYFSFFFLAQIGASFYLLVSTYYDFPLTLFIGSWPPPASIVLMGDSLSISLSLMSAILAFITLLFSFFEFPLENEPSMRLPFFAILNTGIQLAFLTGDLFNFYVALEILLASSYALMCLESAKEKLKHSFPYIAINLIGTSLFLLGIGITYSQAGTLNMADLAIFFASNTYEPLVRVGLLLIVFVLLLKAAVYPLCYWLPESYPIVSFSTASFFSAILTKVGLYGLIRLFNTLLGEIPFEFSEILLFLSGLTMLIGVLGALSKDTLKEILSYHSISQIGYMIFVITNPSRFGIEATLFFMFHHSFVKASLFLIGGAAAQGVKTEKIYLMGGVYDYSPFLSFLFFLQALSLAGLPPLSGFWVKYFSISSGVAKEQYGTVTIALITSLLTLISMIKVWHYAFWTKKRFRDWSKFPYTSAVRGMSLLSLALTLITLTMGFYVEGWFRFFDKISVELLDREQYQKAVLPERF